MFKRLGFLAVLLFAVQVQAGIYAVVSPGGSVVNMVQWDGAATFNVSPNTLVSASGQANAQVGGTYASGVFTAPSIPSPAQGIIFQASPTTGATVSLPNAPQPQAKLYCYLQPAAPLAALTLNLPPTPADGDMAMVLSTKAITSMSVVPGVGAVLLNFTSPVAIAAGVTQRITYSAQLGGWFHE